MKKKSLLYLGLLMGIICLLVLWQVTSSVSVPALAVAKGVIRQYVDDTGTVKSRYSQTVYLENAGRVSSLYVTEGSRVQPGDLLMKLNPADLQLAEVAAEQARINYQSALRDWSKAKELFQIGAISKAELDNTETIYKQAAASMQSADLGLVKQRNSLVVKAPLGGIVLQKSVELNQVVTPGTAAFIIGNPRDLEVEAPILADDVVKIRPGNPVEISGQATGKSMLPGVVTKVAPMAQNIVSSLGVNQKRSVVTISFTGDTGLLKPGYDVDVRIVSRTKPMAITVPASAVFDIQGRNYVFVIVNKRIRLRHITKGIENDEQIEILSGLTVGEWVLVKPDNTLKEGMKVKIAAERGNV